ncbi:cardiolipin synthase [Eubacterium sp. AB3007]|uniref:cardiolipin synthase n=1 Tax=Eubacterium sp. AB3007 TaxID=1392487 RepID=UPI00068F74FE|nr:cardiolipin synthase [Eubacterium sp. AB3007]
MSEKSIQDIFRLAKPKRKGILALIFSRFLLIAALLVLQLAVFGVFFVWLYNYLPHFILFERLFAITMMIYLFSNSMDYSAKTTWMFIMVLVPVAGSAFLLFTQANTGQRAIKRRVEHTIEETRHALPQDPAVRKALLADGGDVDDLVSYLNRSGCFPAFDGTDARFFPSGEAKFQAMLEELAKAEEYIFLEYFIIEEGYMWGEILKILVEKAAAGVEVRVMYDGMCEMSTLPHNYPKLLASKGIKAKSFSPIRPIISSHYNYRDHRKILVIDGKVGFTGGVNLADEYINHIERFGHWKDTAVMLKGPAVQSFTLMFLQMWNVTEKTSEYEPWLSHKALPAGASRPGGYVIPYCDCPLDDDKVGEAVYMDILNRAGTYVHIMTPYLILDGELETALKFAAERGIDVSLILPGIPDKKMAYALAKSHYKSLLRSGVKIYEYTPGFVHAKVCVCDDEKAVVGTINFDYRSLYHHFECATYLYKTDCITEIEADFQDTMSRCRQVTPETLHEERLYYKVMGKLMKFVAPLM